MAGPFGARRTLAENLIVGALELELTFFCLDSLGEISHGSSLECEITPTESKLGLSSKVDQACPSSKRLRTCQRAMSNVML